MTRTIRIDMLPDSVQEQIIALRAKHIGGSGIVTTQQLTRAFDALSANRLPSGSGQDWNTANAATALGRLVMRYFSEYPEQKRTFVAYLNRLKSSGIAVDRTSQGRASTNRKRNGESPTP